MLDGFDPPENYNAFRQGLI